MEVVYENRYGFTKEGKPENCYYTVEYIANRNYLGNSRGKTGLYFAFIDFRKVYDSVDRKKTN